MLSRRKIWLDGKLKPFSQARVHLLCHSFGRGSALFEVMSIHPSGEGAVVFRLDDHIARLFHSAELSHMRLPLSPAGFKRAVRETVVANRVRSGFVKIICYYGAVEFEVVPRNPVVSVAVVAVDPAQDLSAERFNKEERRPAVVTISPWRKIHPATMPVECKCAANYAGGTIAKLEALAAGFSSPLLLDLNGNLAEGPTESLFLVKNGVLKTPALGHILPGITRRTVLELARDLRIETVEKPIKPRELLSADEAFFTSSVVKIWPIVRVDDKVFPSTPGFVTRLLGGALEKITAGKVKAYRHWLAPVR